MVRQFWLCIIIVFLAIRASATIDAVCWHTLFYLPDSATTVTQPYLEIYWQISPRSIHYKEENSMYTTEIETQITFRNDTGIVLQDHFLQKPAPLEKVDAILQQTILDLHRYALPAGALKVELRLSEPDFPKNTYTYTDTLTVQSAPANAPFYSDLQLIDTIYASPQQSIFLKNRRQQIPLCTNFLDDPKHSLHYYAELYQTNTLPAESYPLIQRIYISKRENEALVQKLLRIDTIKGAQLIPVTGTFPIAGLTSGNFYLNMMLDDKDANRIAYKSLFFQRINTHPPAATSDEALDTALEKVALFDLSKTFVSKFTLPQVMAILKMIRPVASASEVLAINGFLKKPSDMYMRYFIYNYFNAINHDNAEQAWKDFADKIRAINKMFGSTAKPGYETERGRVYLKYGKPDERIKVEAEQGAEPYEIWQYNIVPGIKQTNGIFLFYRPGYSVNDYLLLNSTVRGEIRNANWRKDLYTGGTGSTNLNSQAEQYLQQAH